jgi:hypothetical protein
VYLVYPTIVLLDPFDSTTSWRYIIVVRLGPRKCNDLCPNRWKGTTSVSSLLLTIFFHHITNSRPATTPTNIILFRWSFTCLTKEERFPSKKLNREAHVHTETNGLVQDQLPDEKKPNWPCLFYPGVICST